MALKITGLKAKTGAVAVDLFYPNGDPILDEDGKTQAQAFVYGTASKQYRDFEKAKGEKLFANFAKGKTKITQTYDGALKEGLAKVVACTEKITVLVTEEGDKLDNALAIEGVLSDPSMDWMLKQLAEIIDDQSNFF